MLQNKVLKNIFGVLAFLSFFMIIGTTGALEHDTITFTQSIVQGSISMLCFYLFAKLAGAFEPYVEQDNE